MRKALVAGSVVGLLLDLIITIVSVEVIESPCYGEDVDDDIHGDDGNDTVDGGLGVDDCQSAEAVTNCE